MADNNSSIIKPVNSLSTLAPTAHREKRNNRKKQKKPKYPTTADPQTKDELLLDTDHESVKSSQQMDTDTDDDNEIDYCA